MGAISNTGLAALLLVCGVQSAFAQNGAERLDSGERQRLRMELRQRALDERLRGQPPVQYQQAPQPYPALPPSGGGAGGAGGGASGSYGAPMNGVGGYRNDGGGPRLTPEERQQLRLQLREGRLRAQGK
jgi:hypothetical protein